jgi:hypothetical protein
VEKTSSFFVGKVVFLGIKTVTIPPAVSNPRDRNYIQKQQILHLLKTAAP